jgi:ABC-type amino acid transport substrate-binding protein
LYEVPVQAFLVPPADENFRLETRFFGGLSEMLMALDAGVIDGACVPEFVGKYMLAHHDDLRAGMFEFSNTKECYYLGFYNNAQLRDRVNEALSDMKAEAPEAADAWDELEKSVVSHVADDVKISIKGFQTEMTISKKLV